MSSLGHAEFRAMRRFPALDGLRAVAAVMVVFFHYAGPNWTWLVGWLGVNIFFALSGFLITTLLLREEQRGGRVSIANFYIRRAFRILPVYFMVLAIVVAITYLRGEYRSSGLPMLMPHYLTFTNEFIPPGMIYGQSWTLGIEQKFYLVWPLLAFGLGALMFGVRRLGLTLAMLTLIVVLSSVGVPVVSYSLILSGCLLAVVMHSARGFAVLRPLTHPLVGPVAVALLLVAQSNFPDLVGYFGQEIWASVCYAAAVCMLLVSLMGRGPVTWLLSLRPMVFIGERSYSLYLVQGVAGLVVAASIPVFAVHRTITAIVVTIVSLLMADLLYRWLELPMINVGKWLIAHRGRSARTAAIDPVEVVASVEPDGQLNGQRSPAKLASSGNGVA
jgi:peptidoglycan/LPS O-acetylase OafA/YrhL